MNARQRTPGEPHAVPGKVLGAWVPNDFLLHEGSVEWGEMWCSAYLEARPAWPGAEPTEDHVRAAYFLLRHCGKTLAPGVVSVAQAVMDALLALTVEHDARGEPCPPDSERIEVNTLHRAWHLARELRGAGDGGR